MTHSFNRDDGTFAQVDFGDLTNARARLSGDTTYYVRTDGSDSNTGLVNNSGGAFLTIQKAVDVVHDTLDLAGNNVTIQVGDGTYAAGVSLEGAWVGGGSSAANLGSLPVIISGNASTPSNVHISCAADCFRVSHGGLLQVQHMKLTSSANNLIFAIEGGRIYFNDIVFNTVGSGAAQVGAIYGSIVKALGNYSIVGGAGMHNYVADSSYMSVTGVTVTLSGTPAYSVCFALAHGAGSTLSAIGNTYTGAATGQRYLADLLGLIDAGGGANYFPGNSPGSTATNGIYN